MKTKHMTRRRGQRGIILAFNMASSLILLRSRYHHGSFKPPPSHTPSCFLESLQRRQGHGLRFKSILREIIPVDLIDTEFVSH
jgi:hypothetical protein